jgi:PAS domain S-box-containing protein
LTAHSTGLLADQDRLAALARTKLLDSPVEEAFDRLARLATRMLAAPVALVSLVDRDRQFFKACVGLPEPWASTRQTPLSHSYCQHLLDTGQPLVIDDARLDPRVRGNLVIIDLGLLAYLGIPLLTSDHQILGAFCVLDYQPRRWTTEDVAALQDLAASVMTEIELRGDVQARQHVEAFLADHGQQVREALEATADAVVITDADLEFPGPEIVYVNRAMCELTGYPVQELVGRSPRMLQGPMTDSAVLRSLWERLAAGQPWTGEMVNYRKDGSEYLVRLQLVPMQNPAGQITNWMATQQEITSQRELEHRLAQVEASFQALLERVPAVVYTASPEDPNPLTYISPQVEALLGEHPQDCIANPGVWDRWLDPRDAPWVRAECERTSQTGEPFVAEYRVRPRDGQLRWVRDEAVLVRDVLGRPRFWQGILTDVTAAHELADQLSAALEREHHTAEDLAVGLERERAASDQLRALDQTKTTFLQAVSHDLRTPLTAVLGIALTLERCADTFSAAEVTDLLGRLSANARKLKRLLDDLLDLDRLTQGTLSLDWQRVDLGALVRRVAAEADLPDDHTLLVDATATQVTLDAAKTERILENLLVNAGKYTPAGTTIWVTVTDRPGAVLLTVDDDGPGVPPDAWERIFQPFQQAHRRGSHPLSTGIGLALVAQFAALQGGRAWVQDRPGGGASFRVLLPTTPDPATDP